MLFDLDVLELLITMRIVWLRWYGPLYTMLVRDFQFDEPDEEDPWANAVWDYRFIQRKSITLA